MDEHTKQTVRALLRTYPRGYVEEETGLVNTKSAAGLFRLLLLSVLADGTALSGTAIEAAKARTIGAATNTVLERYDGDLENMRDAAGGDGDRLRDLLHEIPGMTDDGCAVFLREAQVYWPEAGPFLDEHAIRAARRLGLPSDPEVLLRDVARGQGEEMLSWLSGALTLTDVHDTYDRIAP